MTVFLSAAEWPHAAYHDEDVIFTLLSLHFPTTDFPTEPTTSSRITAPTFLECTHFQDPKSDIFARDPKPDVRRVDETQLNEQPQQYKHIQTEVGACRTCRARAVVAARRVKVTVYTGLAVYEQLQPHILQRHKDCIEAAHKDYDIEVEELLIKLPISPSNIGTILLKIAHFGRRTR